MPINPRQNESQDDFISRCIRIEIDNGKSQPQAVAICIKKAEDEFRGMTPSVSDATWSTEAPVSINFETYNDYPEAAKNAACKVLRWRDEHGDEVKGMTRVGWTRANQLCGGENISEETIARMSAFQRHKKNSEISPEFEGTPWKDAGYVAWLGWGGTAGVEWASRKLEQIRKQKLEKQDFRKVKKVLFEEEFDVEKVRSMKEMGFKVLVRSSRKIKKRDKKVWNKLKSAGLSEDNLLFGETRELNNKMEFSYIDGEDCIITHLSRTGETFSPDIKVLHSEPVKDILHAKEIDFNLRKQFEGKFRTVKVTYTYKEIDGIPSAKSGSRPFCKDMMSMKGREWTLEELISAENETLKLGMENLADMNLPEDLILYRGGFYRNPETGITTAFCRHEWKVNVRIV